MPSSSRDTGTIKFGGENVPETILRLVIAFFIDKTSNKKQIYIENTPNMVFIFFHAKTGSLPILQECPNSWWALIVAAEEIKSESGQMFTTQLYCTVPYNSFSPPISNVAETKKWIGSGKKPHPV